MKILPIPLIFSIDHTTQTSSDAKVHVSKTCTHGSCRQNTHMDLTMFTEVAYLVF